MTFLPYANEIRLQTLSFMFALLALENWLIYGLLHENLRKYTLPPVEMGIFNHGYRLLRAICMGF